MSDTAIPPCPKFAKGHGCPRSDPFVITENEANGDYYGFRCRTCGTVYAVSTPRGKAHARFQSELNQKTSLRPTERERVYFDIGRNR